MSTATVVSTNGSRAITSVKSLLWKVAAAKRGGVKMRVEVGAEKDDGRVVRAEMQSPDRESLLEQRCSGGLLYDVGHGFGAFAGG